MGQKLSQDLEKTIELREAGNLIKSKIYFKTLIKQVNKKDLLYPRLMSEYIIQLRLESKSLLSKALALGKKLLKEERKKSRPDPLSLRSVSNTLVDLGGYEAAISYLQELCQAYPTNSLRLGEAQAHLAYAYLRVGKLTEALELIKESIIHIKENSAKENYVEVRISYALIIQALIEYNLGHKELAISHANKSLVIATQGHAIHRIAQAKELLSFFDRS